MIIYFEYTIYFCNFVFYSLKIKKRMDIFKEILEWNESRGLLNKGFDKNLEMGFILEELYEGYGINLTFDTKKEFRECVKQNIQEIEASSGGGKITDSELADCFGDIIVFSIGALWKLHKNCDNIPTPIEVMRNIIEANKQKGNKVDSDGKIIKDDGFKPPVHSVN